MEVILRERILLPITDDCHSYQSRLDPLQNRRVEMLSQQTNGIFCTAILEAAENTLHNKD